MVVAEIPLWLVHTSDSGGANGILSRDDAIPEAGEADGDNKLDQAQNSLSLLQNSGRGKKCAIYSIDVNPAGTKLASCGGDGTVKIWSVSALFSKKRSRFSNEGTYESSEASEESSPSDVDENTKSQTEMNGESNEYQDSVHENLVHDLSGFVRRKKGGDAPMSPEKPKQQQQQQQPTPPNEDAPNESSSPARKAPTSLHQQHHHRLLCTLSAHTGSSVLAVRFSHNGKYLASAGDDSSVCIYRKDPSGGAVGNLTEHSSEHWSRIKLCRGHGLDVVGLAWAPDDSHLVSCSLDSETPIIVWKLTDLAVNEGHVTHANVLCNPYKILGKGIHTSTVKGVTFDPAGSYIASSGDDPAVCIWRAHDDWGLERRIDAGSGIFRRWKEDNAQSLSTQTLFRRLSWSTDGAFICSTNCVVKNKHVASTISREGWNVSTSRTAAAGAANLVGHKQPVVASRHCCQLLATKSRKADNGESGSSEEEQDEPAYATLLALGDRHGFVTVWSTRKSRPIFKLQCSETRCTVTDLTWGKVKDNAMLLLVSLLDGHVVALRFKIPDEVGPLLDGKDQAKLFQLRYGIDLDDADGFNRSRLFVGDNSGPKFIENALQMSLENRVDIGNEDEDEGDNDEVMFDGDNAPMGGTLTSTASVKSQQTETESKGKKRVRPVLMSVDDGQAQQKKPATQENGENGKKTTGEKEKETDPLKNAAALAEKASTAADVASPQKRDGASQKEPASDVPQEPPSTPTHATHPPRHLPHPTTAAATAGPIPHSTNRIQSVDLPAKAQKISATDEGVTQKITADCVNSFRVPLGSKGVSLQCADISIVQDGSSIWKDQIVGTTCSALAASHNMLAVGTADGSIQLYGASPTLGWSCGTAFRSHPPLVIGQPIVALQLREGIDKDDSDAAGKLEMLVVSAAGAFGVYQVLPELRLRYKGSIMPAMTHMALGTTGTSGSELRLPKLSRVQITESGRLLLLLSLSHGSSGRSAAAGMESPAARNVRANTGSPSGSAYGSVQAFVYNLPMELWMRISDGRFVLSDFYSTLPAGKSQPRDGVLSRLDDMVRTGALDSTLTPAHRSRANDQSNDIYQQTEEKANYCATRSHCEDRMACALAVGSSSEFKHWLSLYVRTLSLGGHGDLLRVLVDMLLGKASQKDGEEEEASPGAAGGVHWWLSSSPHVLNLDRKSLVRMVVIPEMSKNRALQRLTNEVSMEMDAM